MEKSDHYYLRKEYLKNLQVPTISEVKQELGEELGEAFLVQCPDALKPVMGLAPILKGAGDDLWISPSDILIGKVCLKPPVTNKHIKALTHQGILRIGRDTEIKFWNEAEKEKKKALEEQEEILAFIAELEKRRAVEAARMEERERCEQEKEQMRIEFEARLQYELEQLANQLKEEYELLLIRQKEQLDNDWQLKLEAAVAETVAKLTEQFLKDLEAQEQEFLRKFAVEIKKEQIKRKMGVKEIQECCQENFLQLKHQLECKNIANMMYILCMERRKCQSEREHMETFYQKQMLDLQGVVTEKEVEITRLTRELDEKVKQINLREECLLEILRQFQKFINFALRASPTQAEFLLSVEKMMMFELAQAIAKTDRRHAKRLTRTLFPWKTELKSSTTTLSLKESLKSLIAEDYHQCYNETEPPQSDHSLTSTDYLPAFHYDRHMYVREEFRNMMSQGIAISPSNLIWNRDVEHFMQLLRRSVTSIEEQMQEEEEKELQEEEERQTKIEQEEMKKEDSKQKCRESVASENSFAKYSTSSKKQPRRSVVYFRKSDENANFLFPVFESTSSLNTSPSDILKEIPIAESLLDSTQDMGILEKECCKPCVIPRHADQLSMSGREEHVPLIGTIDSAELHKVSLKPVAATSDSEHLEGVGILCAQDSLFKHRMSLKPTNILLPSRESLEVPNVIALGKRSSKSRRSSSQIFSKSRHSVNSEKNVVSTRSSVQKSSRDSKIHFAIKDQPSILKDQPSLVKDPERPSTESDLQKSEKRPCMNENDIYTMSKLSLARDSFFVHKRSLILRKQSSKLSQEGLKKSENTPSQETLQLRKPAKVGSTQYVERTPLLKKPSKNVMSVESASYYNLSVSSHKEDGSFRDVPLRIPTSKLTMSRDSLELIRSHSKLGELHRDKRKGDSKESIEIKDGILGPHLQGAKLSPIIKLDDDGSRTVKMSHIEVVTLDDEQERLQNETVEEESSDICTELKTDHLIATDSPWLVYSDKEASPPEVKLPSRDNFLTKPNVAHVIGDKKAKEHLQKDEEFALHRASSLLSIFRKHPSLVKIFTPCTK